MLVGLTVDSMRLADVFVALEVLRRQPGVDAQRIMTLGQGASGVLGLYAAILDPGVHQVMLVNPPTTHADAPIFSQHPAAHRSARSHGAAGPAPSEFFCPRARRFRLHAPHLFAIRQTGKFVPLNGHCRSRRRPLRSQVRARVLTGSRKDGDRVLDIKVRAGMHVSEPRP